MADMPTPRFFLAAEAAAGKFYAIGGRRENLSAVEAFIREALIH